MSVSLKLVPLKLTHEMLAAVDDMAEDRFVARGRAVDIWDRLLNAAPATRSAEEHHDEIMALVRQLTTKKVRRYVVNRPDRPNTRETVENIDASITKLTAQLSEAIYAMHERGKAHG